MKAPFAVGEMVHTSACMETPPLVYNEPPSGYYIVDRIHPALPTACKCPVCKERPTQGISILGWDCGPTGFNNCCFRPLNPDDYEALRQKHGIPATVKTE